ncbi:MAG: hypothetical protein RMX96_25420 [Nostoc sp. ChiSLP02]|nr:hypothetical protein [Nostoc sp. DedSLP05]MDZ8100831.1 hypothetical protein [Nostoc sp. DedSLP01]MDZ8188180.1 hypothetical protein [Nostoc sp. ChiSLP02]
MMLAFQAVKYIAWLVLRYRKKFFRVYFASYAKPESAGFSMNSLVRSLLLK